MKQFAEKPAALLFSMFAFFVSAVGCNAADAAISPHAKVQPVGLDEIHWTRGFWADRFELCRTQMIPNMERLMEGTNYSQYFQNFRIVAGLAEGKPRGAPFNDGDFYKWLEGACAVLAVSNDAELDQRIDESSAHRAAQRSCGLCPASARNGTERRAVCGPFFEYRGSS
jgi:hypothetical protein